jgi:dihydroorotate dehydrogenase
MGGLSGTPLRKAAQERLALLHRRTEGRKPLNGVGGIFDADDAYARIRAGASLVQVYTGLIYRGPGMVYAINRGLAARLRRDGFKTLTDAVGAG